MIAPVDRCERLFKILFRLRCREDVRNGMSAVDPHECVPPAPSPLLPSMHASPLPTAPEASQSARYTTTDGRQRKSDRSVPMSAALRYARRFHLMVGTKLLGLPREEVDRDWENETRERMAVASAGFQYFDAPLPPGVPPMAYGASHL